MVLSQLFGTRKKPLPYDGPDGPSSEVIAKAAEDFERDGYAILRQAVAHDQIDAFWDEAEALRLNEPELTFGMMGKILKNREVLDGTYDKDASRLRITSIENFSRLAPEMLLHPAISSFLGAWYGGLAPTCIQSLTYKYSSEQGAHSDKFLVSPRSVGDNYDRDRLTAAWIACEPVDEENGTLVIYPGSHKLEKKRLKQDFGGDYRAYREYLEALCTDNGIAPERFHAEKGDILFWHGDFVHAGGKILNPERTRRSVVAHYVGLAPGDAGARAGRQKIAASHGWYFVDKKEKRK